MSVDGGFSSSDHTPLPPAGSWVERNGFSHWATVILWIVLVFILFQTTAAVVTVLLLSAADPGMDFTEGVTERLDLLFIGNSAGQVLFLLLATFLVAGLHVQPGEAKRDFLRLRVWPNTWQMVGYSALLFVVVQPLIMFIGYLNTLLPVPDYFGELQDLQYETIENFLTSEGAVLTGLLHIALVPAICEEVMFRGYVQGALERQWGSLAAILVSGLLFGLFHLQLSNLLPLAALGMLLALVTWLSGSLLPAMAAHFINNGGAVILGNHYPEMAFSDLTAETAPSVWLLLASAALTWLIVRQLFFLKGADNDGFF